MSQYVENIIQEKMDKINSKGNVYEVGRVIGVTDYIVEVSGLIQVSFNEKVVIAGHSIGYVSLIRRNSILFGFRHDLFKYFQSVFCAFRNTRIVAQKSNYLPVLIFRQSHNRKDFINLISLA